MNYARHSEMSGIFKFVVVKCFYFVSIGILKGIFKKFVNMKNPL